MSDTKDRIDKEMKKILRSHSLQNPKTDRGGVALALSLLALAGIEKDDSKAKKLLDLLKDIDL